MTMKKQQTLIVNQTFSLSLDISKELEFIFINKANVICKIPFHLIKKFSLPIRESERGLSHFKRFASS